MVGGSNAAKCLDWKKMGETCESSWQCGLIDSVCLNGKCAPMPKIGEACADIGPGKLCALDTACDPATSKCVALPTSGECINYRCAEGFECTCGDNTCSTNVCKAAGKAGDSCGSQELPNCAEGLMCNQQGKCEAAVCM